MNHLLSTSMFIFAVLVDLLVGANLIQNTDWFLKFELISEKSNVVIF